jgi:hypothetical protein
MSHLISGTEEEVTGRSWDWSHPPPLKCQGIAINEEQCGAMTEEQCGAMTDDEPSMGLMSRPQMLLVRHFNKLVII